MREKLKYPVKCKQNLFSKFIQNTKNKIINK